MKKGFTIKVLDHGFVRFIQCLGSDQRIVEAARISYKSPSKGVEADKKLIHYLMKNKHTSPFEMPHVCFNIKMPIFVMRQYVRHRMQNLNEVSARYTKLSKEFYVPNSWREQDTKNKQGSIEGDNLKQAEITTAYVEACNAAYELYESMLQKGVAREMARMILPVSIYTEIYATWDLKNLLHFVRLRDDSHAQSEIQEYGKAIKRMLIELFPITMEAYEEHKN